VARVEVEQATIRSWTDPFGEVRAQIIVSVTNGGTAAASLPRSGTAYRVMSRDGTVVALGRFAHVFPTVVGPDETAWFIDTLSATLANQSELADVEVALEAVARRARERRDPNRGERRCGRDVRGHASREDEQRHDHDPAADPEEGAEKTRDGADQD